MAKCTQCVEETRLLNTLCDACILATMRARDSGGSAALASARGLSPSEIGHLTAQIEQSLEETKAEKVENDMSEPLRRLRAVFDAKGANSIYDANTSEVRKGFTSMASLTAAVAAGVVCDDTPVRTISYRFKRQGRRR